VTPVITSEVLPCVKFLEIAVRSSGSDCEGAEVRREINRTAKEAHVQRPFFSATSVRVWTAYVGFEGSEMRRRPPLSPFTHTSPSTPWLLADPLLFAQPTLTSQHHIFVHTLIAPFGRVLLVALRAFVIPSTDWLICSSIGAGANAQMPL